MRNGTPGAREKKSRDPPHPLSRDNLRPVSISARDINWLSRPCSEEEISDRVSRYTYIIQVKEFAAVRWRVIDGRDYILFFCLPARSLSVNNCSRRGDTVSLPRLRMIEFRNWKFEKRRHSPHFRTVTARLYTRITTVRVINNAAPARVKLSQDHPRWAWLF